MKNSIDVSKFEDQDEQMFCPKCEEIPVQIDGKRDCRCTRNGDIVAPMNWRVFEE